MTNLLSHEFPYPGNLDVTYAQLSTQFFHYLMSVGRIEEEGQFRSKREQSSPLPQYSDPQVICYVAEQCASAIRLEVDQLLRAADRCVQLGSPTVAFELCLMDRTGATDSKAREVAKLLDEDTASEVAAALGTAHRTVYSKIVGFTRFFPPQTTECR